MKAQLAKLRRMQFGRSSEKLDAQIEQLELLLEFLRKLKRHASRRPWCPMPMSPVVAGASGVSRYAALCRIICRAGKIVHSPGEVGPDCGGAYFSRLGEDVIEVLEKIPARLKVIRHNRPKLSCRVCETILLAPSPDLPIEKGRPGPRLIANVVMAPQAESSNARARHPTDRNEVAWSEVFGAFRYGR